MTSTDTQPTDSRLSGLFSAGAHFGYAKSRRHPSASAYLFGMKQRNDIFDLEKTSIKLEEAKAFAESLGRERKVILFVSSKPEGVKAIKAAASATGMPYVASRWIGGTITNFSEIKKRVARLGELTEKRERGEFAKYTKLERLRIDREIDKLELMYGGLVSLADRLPAALFVVDSKKEAIAVREARAHGIPVIALASSDCDLTVVDYPIPANDTLVKSVSYVAEAIASAYNEGVQGAPLTAEVPEHVGK